MKPMVKYRGGKGRELHEILPFVPSSFERYIEPFFGGGALYFRLEAENAIVNDLNRPLMNFYQTVRNNFDQLRTELDELEKLYKSNRTAFEEAKAATPNERVYDANETLYYQIRDMYNGIKDSPFLDATLYFFINKTSYSGMIRHNKKGEFNVPYGRYKNFNTQLVSRAHSKLLQTAQVTNGDYAEVFDQCTPKDFVFLDPPYDSIFSDYGNAETIDGFSENSHRRLASDFFNLPSQALLVIGETDLTKELYGSNVIHTYEKAYAVNIRNRFKARSRHLLVSNK